LWVVEVKDHIASASSYSISARVGRFLRPRKGYVAKLEGKVAAVAARPDAAAELVTGPPLPAPPGGWRVHPLLATRRLEPAAFALDPPPAPFVLVRDLAAHLRGEDRSYGRRGAGGVIAEIGGD
jgi:hypothetical protein